MRITSLIILLLGMTMFLSGCAEPGEDAYNDGVNSLNEGKTAEARTLFLSALDENPNIAEAYLNLGRIDIKQGEYVRARKNTLKALEILEESRKTIISGATWEQQAALACNNMASIAFQQALKLKREGDNDSRETKRLFEEAESWLEKATELDTANETIQKNQKFIQNWDK